MIVILNILDNLISLTMLAIGYVINDLILLIKSPLGFAVFFSSTIFFEYLATKSILHKSNGINFKTVLEYIKNYKHTEKDESLISLQWPILNAISKSKNLSIKKISESTGINMYDTRKSMMNLADEGRIIRKNINENKFYYIAFKKHKERKIYNIKNQRKWTQQFLQTSYSLLLLFF